MFVPDEMQVLGNHDHSGTAINCPVPLINAVNTAGVFFFFLIVRAFFNHSPPTH